MRLSSKAMGLAAGILWAGGILFVGLLNLAMPSYGAEFLQVFSSVYPWFHNTHTIGSVIIATADGFVDGALAGLLLAWIYNALSGAARPAPGAPHGD
ncbi:MAG TPA: hypothetical protein VMV61_00985 [Patescibacteria group bacterium]|nr:hypothetical protein [Patescibacteria group bacterium]